MGVLIFLDLCWATAAFLYDLPVLLTIPGWAVPFIIICPFYPLPLAAAWRARAAGRPPHPLVANLATIPPAVYGILSLLFYPLAMRHTGFMVDDFLQIPWVWFYAAQAWYLLLQGTTFHPRATPAVAVFAIASFTVQFLSDSYGYLDLAILTPGEKAFLLGSAALATLIVSWLAYARRTKPATLRPAGSVPGRLAHPPAPALPDR